MSSPPAKGFGMPATTVIGWIVSTLMALALFLATSSYVSLTARLERMEASQALQNETLAMIHVQLDTINARGTAAADTRLTALEQRMALAENRIGASPTPH